MDRNSNFDYRNFFYPGPAPLPVQIYPVNGDPRFPFHFPSGTPNTNMARRGSASPSARENITADEAALDQASPPTGGVVAKRDSAASAAASQATTTTAPVKLDHVIQGLSHLLGEATAFCEESLKTHKEVVAVAGFAGHATRNRLWRELLESRFEASGVHKDLLHTLVPRVRRYTQQAQQAAAAAARDDHHPPGGGGGPDEAGSDDGDAHYRLALMVDKLSAQCDWIGRASRKALGNSAACEDMVELMREMKELCGKIVPGVEAAPQDGQEGGDRQY